MNSHLGRLVPRQYPEPIEQLARLAHHKGSLC